MSMLLMVLIVIIAAAAHSRSASSQDGNSIATPPSKPHETPAACVELVRLGAISVVMACTVHVCNHHKKALDTAMGAQLSQHCL